jgi:hypothetical protein
LIFNDWAFIFCPVAPYDNLESNGNLCLKNFHQQKY